ncbi:MAG: hypothetical protein IID30_02370 [Planctomycetes bacterium]|nr:hypothetical protein [Planctomycetota bacterium]
MDTDIKQSGACKPVKGRYAIELPEDEYVKLWGTLMQVRERPVHPRRWIARIVQVCIALVIAFFCSRFEQSKYFAMASTVYAVQAALSLVAPNARSIRALRYAGGIGIVILLCLWPYTIPLGAITALALLPPLLGRPMARISARREWRRTTHFHGTFECGFDEESIWLVSKNMKARCRWSEINWWALTSEWLVLFPESMTRVFFPLGQLQKTDMFDHLLTLAKEHSQPFGTPPRPRSKKGEG